VLAFAAPADGRDAPMIFCGGWRCDGGGLPNFNYPIDSGSYPMMEFRVGVNDLDGANYSFVLAPPGWNFAIEATPMNHSCANCGDHTPHGAISPGPCWCMTAGCARWWTDDPQDAVEYFTFGFDHPWTPEDVGWELTTRRPGPPPQWNTFGPFWDAPTGVGMGPVHGPCSPPSVCAGNTDCGADEYCYRPSCDAVEGFCAPRPTFCPSAWLPVCGCDGMTYGNACFAAMAGVNIDYPGPCDNYCPADVNGDNTVDVLDLLMVLAAWGDTGVPEDINEDGIVDVLDLLEVIAAWGPCAPRIGGWSHEPCTPGGGGPPDEWCDPDIVEIVVQGSSLQITHENGAYNCCLDDIVVNLVIEGNVITLTEQEVLTIPCPCICCYTVHASVVDLVPGTYTVFYCWDDPDTGGQECHEEVVSVP
jgi:hypothetical protein